MVAITEQLHLQILFPSLKPLNHTWSECRFFGPDENHTGSIFVLFVLFCFSPPLHRAFYSKNLYGSKVRWGEHFTQAKKTRHYTPHNVWKTLSLLVRTNIKKMTTDYTNDALLVTLRHLKLKGSWRVYKMVFTDLLRLRSTAWKIWKQMSVKWWLGAQMIESLIHILKINKIKEFFFCIV